MSGRTVPGPPIECGALPIGTATVTSHGVSFSFFASSHASSMECGRCIRHEVIDKNVELARCCPPEMARP